MGRDHTVLPKRVKPTLSNEERSLATRERKAVRKLERNRRLGSRKWWKTYRA